MTANSNRTVLISGPAPLLRTRARDQLEAEGVNVIEAESDAEAWERYQVGDVDRIVVAERFVTLP